MPSQCKPPTIRQIDVDFVLEHDGAPALLVRDGTRAGPTTSEVKPPPKLPKPPKRRQPASGRRGKR